jgi:hypothetical protein
MEGSWSAKGMRRMTFGCGFKITPTGEGDVIREQAESRLIKWPGCRAAFSLVQPAP